MNYSDKLKDPRWQRKRLEIMQRDDFQCQRCFDRDTTLTVHHKWYIKSNAPWDYPDECFVTYCEDCHDSYHKYFEHKLDDRTEVLGGATKTDVHIYDFHIWKLMSEQGFAGFKLLLQTLISMTIKKEEI